MHDDDIKVNSGDPDLYAFRPSRLIPKSKNRYKETEPTNETFLQIFNEDSKKESFEDKTLVLGEASITKKESEMSLQKFANILKTEKSAISLNSRNNRNSQVTI